jgi:quinol monooxygenase YgiN
LDRPNQFLLLAASRQGLPLSIADMSRFKQSSLADDQIMPDFNLDSTYMIGSENLVIPLGAFAMVAHMDADPVQREQTATQLRKLGSLIPELRGNQGVQILTWKKRPNHWTIVTLWKDINSYLAALEDPRIMGICAVIASHAAAPADLRLYQRVD